METYMPLTDNAVEKIIESQNAEKRVVVVIGAGVSTEADIPTGDEMRSHLDDKVRLAIEDDSGRGQGADFFQLMENYATYFGREEAYEFLRSQLDKSSEHPLSPSYEFLAHLLHHNYINAVISLNLDEIFDKSLNNEAPIAGGIEFAVSLSEFDSLGDKILNQSEDKLPKAYLKPHGTIQRRMTIRAIWEQVKEFEPEKVNVLEKYLHQATIILLGWSWRDPDFSKILHRALSSEGTQLVAVNPIRGRISDLVQANNGIFVQSKSAGFVEELSNRLLANKLKTKLQAGKQTDLGIKRHEIRCAFFSKNEDLELPFVPDLYGLASLEILMLALKARAQFEPRTVYECVRISAILEKIDEGRGDGKPIALTMILNDMTDQDIFKRGYNERNELIYWLPYETDSDLVEDILIARDHRVGSGVLRATEARQDRAVAHGRSY